MDKKNLFRELAADQLLFAEGDEGWEMFIVISGKVQIFLLRDGLQVVLANLGAGHFFGEMSLLEGETRSANVVAAEPSKLLIINHDNFQQFITKNPSLAVKLMKGLSGRLRKSNEQVSNLEAELHQHGKRGGVKDKEDKSPAGIGRELTADELAWRLEVSLQLADKHQISCPVCHNNFKAHVLPLKNLKKQSSDFWFREHYEGVEPLLFRHICCSRCFFAAPQEIFLETGQLQKDRLKSNERERRSRLTLPEHEEMDYEHAISYYKLALLCLEDSDDKLPLLSRLALELAWLCREMGKEEDEREALEQASEYLERLGDVQEQSAINLQKSLYLQSMVAFRMGDMDKGKALMEQVLEFKEKTVVHLMGSQIMEKLANNLPLPI